MQERGARVYFAAGLLAGLLLGVLLALPAFPRPAESVPPAVVNIRTQSLSRGQRSPRSSPLPLDPFFREFFEQAPEGGRGAEQTSLGSGVIIDRRGLSCHPHPRLQ